jgi:hypothetical protein
MLGEMQQRIANRDQNDPNAVEPAPLQPLPNGRFGAPANQTAPGYLDPRSAQNYVQPGYTQPNTYGRQAPPARFVPNQPSYPQQYQQSYPPQYAPQQYAPQQYQYPQPQYQQERWIYQR